jgi:EAL domain-containing protein (putative c-di-GMP-specific phosphodiesterase class I)
MRSETGEIIGSDQFIEAAERSNMVSTLDRWVIHKALSEFVDSKSVGEARYTLAINLSGTSLSEDRFRSFVIDELAGQKLPQGAICFEITPTAASISDFAGVSQFLQELKERGCLLTQDNFGTGLFSYGDLKNFPTDYLKIHGSFVKEILYDPIDREMVRSINEIGHLTGKQTIAEFAENEEIITMLRGMGIDYAQGNYIAPPASVQTFEPLGEILVPPTE